MLSNLESLKLELIKRGVVDVKLVFAEGRHDVSTATDSLCKMLETYLLEVDSITKL